MQEMLNELGWDIERLTPDKSKLDQEFESHPADVARVCEKLAEARFFSAQIKARRGQAETEARAKLILQFNRTGTKYTVGDLSAAIDDEAEVRTAARNQLECERDVEMWAGMLKALETKTSALKHLSELWQAGYYTTTSSREREVVRGKRGRD